jgi:hypothetical protein
MEIPREEATAARRSYSRPSSLPDLLHAGRDAGSVLPLTDLSSGTAQRPTIFLPNSFVRVFSTRRYAKSMLLTSGGVHLRS